MGNFASSIAAFAATAAVNTDAVVRSAERALFGAIIAGTPCDTGLAISNWICSVDAPDTSVRVAFEPGKKGSGGKDRVGKHGSKEHAVDSSVREANVDASTADMATKVGGAGMVTYLSNNLPYAYGLEFGTNSYGYSKQAPEGMVRINVARWQQIVDDVAEALS